MIKFIKYDIKGTLKMLLGFLLGGIFASFAVNYAVFLGRRDDISVLSRLPKIQISEFIGFTGGLVGAIVVISFIVYSISYYYKEISSNKKYLTFQTPEKSWKIIASKLFLMGVWSAIYIVVGTFVNSFLVGIFNKEISNEIITFLTHFDISLLIQYLAEILSILSIIYMCITFQKMVVANRRFGAMWVVALMVIIFLYIKIRTMIYTPSSYVLEPGQALYLYKIFDLFEGREYIKLIFNAITIFVTTFIGGYVLDKKSDI